MIAILETDFLQQLGERIRAWRSEHGTTRKALVSALATQGDQLLLARIARPARATSRAPAPARPRHGPPLEALVRESENKALVALIGLRGAGKSTLGAKLAESLKVPFVELDKEVEKEAGAELGEVFAMYGQDAFRRFERRALERVLAQHPRAVIAAGGSLVTAADTYKLLLARCFCVWLKTRPEEHMARVIEQGDMRPFKGRSAALDEIKKLLEDRAGLYARANATLETSGKTVRQSLAELKKAIADQLRDPPRPLSPPELACDGPLATLTLDVAEDHGLVPSYKLKLSYDLGVDISSPTR
jgi:shikimate kinase